MNGGSQSLGFQVSPVGEISPNAPPKFPFGGEFLGDDKKKNDVSC